MAPFAKLFGQTWTTFYFNIWAHCLVKKVGTSGRCCFHGASLTTIPCRCWTQILSWREAGRRQDLRVCPEHRRRQVHLNDLGKSASSFVNRKLKARKWQARTAWSSTMANLIKPLRASRVLNISNLIVITSGWNVTIVTTFGKI